MAAGLRKTQRKQDPEAVRANILEVAVEQFATLGLPGARIDEIARKTTTSKRMIYYYFTDKEGLYRAALEREYERARSGEWDLDLSGLDPVEAMRRLVGFTFDFHRQNRNFVRLVANENIRDAAYLVQSDKIRDVNRRAIDRVGQLYREGVTAGVFRGGLDPVALHWHISAMCFYNESNRCTFSAGFGGSLHSEAGQTLLRDFVIEAALRNVLTPDALARLDPS